MKTFKYEGKDNFIGRKYNMEMEMTAPEVEEQLLSEIKQCQIIVVQKDQDLLFEKS